MESYLNLNGKLLEHGQVMTLKIVVGILVIGVSM